MAPYDGSNDELGSENTDKRLCELKPDDGSQMIIGFCYYKSTLIVEAVGAMFWFTRPLVKSSFWRYPPVPPYRSLLSNKDKKKKHCLFKT